MQKKASSFEKIEHLIQNYTAEQLKQCIDFGVHLLSRDDVPVLKILYELEIYHQAYEERRCLEAI